MNQILQQLKSPAMREVIMRAILESADITDERTVSALVKLSNTKFVFGEPSLTLQARKIAISIDGQADGENFTFSTELTGNLADELLAIVNRLNRSVIAEPGAALVGQVVVPVASGDGFLG